MLGLQFCKHNLPPAQHLISRYFRRTSAFSTPLVKYPPLRIHRAQLRTYYPPLRALPTDFILGFKVWANSAVCLDCSVHLSCLHVHCLFASAAAPAACSARDSVSRNPGTSEPRGLRALRLSLVTHESLFVTSARPRASLRVSLHLRRQLIVVRTRASLPQQSLACFSLALVKRVVTKEVELSLTLLCSLCAARHSYVKEANDATTPKIKMFEKVCS